MERRYRDERDYEATDYYELLTGIKCEMIHMTPRYCNVDVTIVVDDMRQHTSADRRRDETKRDNRMRRDGRYDTK